MSLFVVTFVWTSDKGKKKTFRYLLSVSEYNHADDVAKEIAAANDFAITEVKQTDGRIIQPELNVGDLYQVKVMYDGLELITRETIYVFADSPETALQIARTEYNGYSNFKVQSLTKTKLKYEETV